MRIEFNQGPAETNVTSAKASAATAQSINNIASLGEDQAQLSGAHAQVQALAAQAAQLPEVRQEKVQALREAIEAGHYHASAENVAGAMLAHIVAAPAA
jgi:flagellar biosynthesis anti-sigma factor FlgM